MNGFIRVALRPEIFRRSVIVGLVVGAILNIINQGDAIFGPATFNLTKCLLTFVVPYCVATYGAVCALREIEAQE